MCVGDLERTTAAFDPKRKLRNASGVVRARHLVQTGSLPPSSLEASRSLRCREPCGGVRRPEVREIGKQIAVWANAVRRHLPVREDREEVVLDVVGEHAAILGIRGRLRMIEEQDVREQRCGHPLRIGSGVAAGVFERVREHGDELAVASRFRGVVGGDCLAAQEGGLPRSPAAVGLHQRPPAPSKVRAQMPTLPGAKETLGISRTMLHTSLSAKKSWRVNLKPSSTPSTSKKKGSLRQPARGGARRLCYVRRLAQRRLPRWPPRPGRSATRRLRPPLKAENRTRQAMSAMASASVSILSS